jgi:hypothetical protein
MEMEDHLYAPKSVECESVNVAAKPRLLDQVRDAIRLKHYSIRTEHAYIDWVRRYILFHDKIHPKDLGEQHIKRFLTHLAVNTKVASSTQNQALSALVFLYCEVLKIQLGDFMDLKARFGAVYLPFALERKYKNANRSCRT